MMRLVKVILSLGSYTYIMLKKITLREVKKAIKLQGGWSGYIVANNVNVNHVISGWHLGAWVDTGRSAGRDFFNQIGYLKRQETSYVHYNGDAELWNGNRYVHYYEVSNASN